VPAGTYTATASALSHVDAIAIVQIEAAQTTLQDFDLRLFEPCLVPTPTTFSLTLSMGTLWTETLTISNGGARDLAWTLRETTDTLALPALPPIPPFEGEWPADPVPASIEPAPWSVGAPPGATGGVPQGDEAPAALPELLGEPAYALDTSTFDLVHIPDLTEPGSWNVVANLAVFYSGGDFWHGDFSKMYAFDFWTNEFVTIDTSTGERTVIGTANTLPGHHWTGLTAATDGTLYGVSAECNTASALYTIDRLSGEATLVGTTTAAPCLIDVAVNMEGELYAVDISSDALFQLDPASGAATAIGLLGFDANHAQALDFEEETDVLYWAAVDNNAGSLRRIDTDTGNSLHLGYWPNYTGVDCLALATGGGDPFWGDVPWVREVPTAGLTLAGDAMEVDVIFDTTVLTTSQCYEADLGLIHDDPYHEEPAMMPLTLCVEAPWPVFYVDKTVAPGQPLPGETTTYTIVFGNDGSLETGIAISDVLPAGAEYAWSEPAGAYDPAAHVLSWGGLVLDEGARMTATAVVTVGMDMEPGTWLTNTAYLLWRDDVLSNWVSFQVGGEAWQYVYLPVVVKHRSGD
jgi:uncharacterized repeat protein (TIGR01451 family)